MTVRILGVDREEKGGRFTLEVSQLPVLRSSGNRNFSHHQVLETKHMQISATNLYQILRDVTDNR